MIAIKNNQIEYTATKPLNEQLIDTLTKLGDMFTHPPEYFIQKWFPFNIEHISKDPNQHFSETDIDNPIIEITSMECDDNIIVAHLKLSDPTNELDPTTYTIRTTKYNRIMDHMNRCLLEGTQR